MIVLKSWRIKECGWETYYREVVELSHGRFDVYIECPREGVLLLVQKEQP